MDFAEVVRQHIVAAILKGMRFPRHKRLACRDLQNTVLNCHADITQVAGDPAKGMTLANVFRHRDQGWVSSLQS